MLSKEEIIDHHVLTFDPGDKRNGSLYIGTPPGSGGNFDVTATLGALRAAKLWSDVAPKTVADEQKQAYKDQMRLVDCVEYDAGFLVARFDHPKFPSDAARWQAWLKFFDDRHARSLD